MFLNLKIVRVHADYCDYLRKFDHRVSYNCGKKELRPFVGVLFEINGTEYFAPLSSPKPKHRKMKNSLDFFKINDGMYGAVNFNNMIPVKSNNYVILDLYKETFTIEEEKYQSLLREQYRYLNESMYQVRKKAERLYQLYVEDRLPENIRQRCCNFPLLEEKCEEYNTLTMEMSG